MKALKQVEISQEIVEELIGCEKLVCKAPPSHLTLDKGNYKLSFTLQDSENPQHLFECFVRVSKFFPENFSVGMQFNPKHDPYRLLLIRMNGAHGPHQVFDHHDRPHIHIMDATELHKKTLTCRRLYNTLRSIHIDIRMP